MTSIQQAHEYFTQEHNTEQLYINGLVVYG
jgi:hypothetical protein